eukprot:g1430.t1
MSRVRSANLDHICSSLTIPTKSIVEVLAPQCKHLFTTSKEIETNHTKCRKIVIPLLQRRYCWGVKQLGKLVQDIVSLAKEGPILDLRGGHSFGRIIIAERKSHSLILDGQQRLTSLCIFLASLRDFLQVHGGKQSCKHIDGINKVLFPDLSRSTSTVLTPTYLDRKSFNIILAPRAKTNDGERILTDCSTASSVSDNHDNIIQAKQFIDKCILQVYKSQSNSPLELGLSMTRAILHNSHVLEFSCMEKDIFSIYERLAYREEGILRQFANANAGVTMAESDLMRNYLLSFFESESEQLRVYQKYWLPIEKQAKSYLSIPDLNSDSSRSQMLLLDVLVDVFLNEEEKRSTDEEIRTRQNALAKLKVGGAFHLMSNSYFMKYRSLRDYVDAIIILKPSKPAVDIVEKVLERLLETIQGRQFADSAKDLLRKQKNTTEKTEMHWSMLNGGRGKSGRPPTTVMFTR